MSTRRSLLCGLALAALAAGCSKSSAPSGAPAAGASGAPATGEILVGAYFSLSGEETQFGKDSQEGIVLATDQLNSDGGVKGRKVKVLFEDTKSMPQEATNKVRQLIDRNKVVALLGEVASSRSLAGGLIANAAKVPMITPSSTNVEVTRGRDFVFRVCFTDDAQGAAAAEFVTEKLKKKKIGLLYLAQDTYSSGLAKTFSEAVKKHGGEIVVEKGYQKGEKNFRTHLDQLMAAKPEIVFVPNYYSDMVPIAQQAKEKNIPGSMFLGGDGWDSEDLLKGAATELEGAYFTNHYAPDVPWENSKKFVAAYQARWKREPSSLAAQAYDAAKLLFDAMGRAKAIEPVAIRDAVAETRGFSGATGTISIDKDRNADKPLVVVQIKGGKFVYHATVNEKRP
ncbi:MAG: ABC transporter substrate-binding protein [Polyangiaceae bacterium]|nr:ABC transporter substrate-binding protein [Polyangiaceae bacterium]